MAVLSLALVVSPGAGMAPRQLPAGANAFVLDLDTSGGFHGRGLGGVTIDSEGLVRGSGMGGTNRRSSPCRARLGADDLASLRRAVDAVGPEPWPETFAPEDDGCCDRHAWTLRLERRDPGGQTATFSTRWYDGNEHRLPKEMVAIKDIAMRALKPALGQCGR